MSWTRTAVGMVGERTPVDLGVIAAWTVLSAAWAVTVGNAIQLVTAVLALPILLVFPGYVAVAALFPESSDPASDGSRGDARRTAGSSPGISPLERAVLSVFTSLLVVPLAALATNFTPWGIGPATILFAVSLVTLVGTAGATVRRFGVPPDRQFGWAVDDLEAAGRSGRNPVGTISRAMAGESTAATALNVVLVVVVVAAVGSVAQAVVLDNGPGYTETYLLTENESEGLVAAGYPTNLTAGESTPLIVGVQNHHSRASEYTIVAQLQRVESSGNATGASSNATRASENATEVVETQSVGEFDRRLAPGERALVDHAVTPELTGDRLRLTYLVYRGEPPAEPSAANADSEVHLWVGVSGNESGASQLIGASRLSGTNTLSQASQLSGPSSRACQMVCS
ncbi:DUF1616 domain-containing protein [Halorussus litoreus]|uniref:DUF1616 domain-containing protein n=1 Tax=Halorussus litoreus TaxID=1710536 RepID=UPI0013008FF4|nr:DUF1616 domain-containing protein [Halorussus litoreus]